MVKHEYDFQILLWVDALLNNFFELLEKNIMRILSVEIERERVEAELYPAGGGLARRIQGRD